jgi:putative CRISPR-associated protein (TIGR02620 family)
MEKIVVTRHQNVVQWLVKYGHVEPDVQVIAHANYKDIKNKEVFGVLPMFLAHAAGCVHHIDLNKLPAEKRGQELSVAEMEEYGAFLQSYKVLKLEDWESMLEDLESALEAYRLACERANRY